MSQGSQLPKAAKQAVHERGIYHGNVFTTCLTYYTIDVMIIPDSEEEETGSQTVNSAWSSNTHIAISAAGNILLTSSAADVQDVFKSSMLALEKHLIFTNAYPDSNPQQKFSFIKRFLTHEAQVQAPWIFDRLRQDPEYMKVLTESVSTLYTCFT